MFVLRRLRELWAYRDLVYNLVVRDLKARYKNSILGVAWSWMNPLLMMVVYTVVFNILAGRSNLPHYPVFILCALLPWNFFSSAVAQATNSIVEAAPLIKKVYFPREVLPISAVLSNMVNFLIALPVFFLLALVLGNPITGWALLFPVTLVIQVMFTLGVSFLTATLNVFYRDTRLILDVLLLAWFFLTPIFYPLTTVPERYVLWGIPINVRAWLLRLNPMASVISSYRDLLYWGTSTAWDFLVRTAVTALGVLVVGYLVFLHYSPRFGEEV
ncbi:MAG: ABC transporter permease [Thermoflexia bacterium]|nr:MAG: ABC transporter permease [Thermoflexia bacterium]